MEDSTLLKYSQYPDIYEILTRSFAPNIWEMDDVKKGILCLLFGGANKAFNSSVFGKFRGEINVLLCGDPGTSKSTLLGNFQLEISTCLFSDSFVVLSC